MSSHRYIFLSPHFDDVALSCGGLLHHLSRQGRAVEVWTIMGGFPPEDIFSDFAQKMHLEWGMTGAEVVRVRRGEDNAACQVMTAQLRHFDWLDAIYRQELTTGLPMVSNNDELFGKSPETELVQQIKDMLLLEIPEGAKLVIPISLGNHIDHRAVRQAGELSGRVDLYYADYPYVLKDPNNPQNHPNEWSRSGFQLDKSDRKAWHEAVLCYASQLSMFWCDEDEVKLALRNYSAGGGGRLWQKPTTT